MNKKLKPTLSMILCLMAVLSTVLLSGCDFDMLFDLAVDWAVAEGIYDGGDTINYVNLGRKMTDDAIDSFFNRGTQEQLMSGEVVNDVRQADELANAGAIAGDTSLIDEAIQLRPNDWSYTEKRSAVLLAQGQTAMYIQSLNSSEMLVKNSIANGNDCVGAYRNLYQQRVAAISQQLEYYPGNEALISELGYAQKNLDNPGQYCN